MKLKLNKDFLHEYKNDAWKGFSIPEIMSISVALACNLGCTYILWKYLHIAPDKAVYFGIPVMIPPLAIGFVKIQDNLTITAYAKAIYDTYRCRELSFAGEQFAKRRLFFMQHCEERADRRHKRKGGKRR